MVTNEARGIDVTVAGTATVPLVTVRGELDLSTADTVRGAVAPVFTDACERVELDLAQLEFLDSSGLAVFIEMAARLPVSIRAASDAVRRIIAVTGLEEVLGLPE
jgi:anti-sigma B factor antagonist